MSSKFGTIQPNTAELAAFERLKKKNIDLRGLLFKFVDFLYSRSEVLGRVLNVISSENIFFPLSFDV